MRDTSNDHLISAEFIGFSDAEWRYIGYCAEAFAEMALLGNVAEYKGEMYEMRMAMTRIAEKISKSSIVHDRGRVIAKQSYAH